MDHPSSVPVSKFPLTMMGCGEADGVGTALVVDDSGSTLVASGSALVIVVEGSGPTGRDVTTTVTVAVRVSVAVTGTPAVTVADSVVVVMPMQEHAEVS